MSLERKKRIASMIKYLSNHMEINNFQCTSQLKGKEKELLEMTCAWMQEDLKEIENSKDNKK